MTTEKKRLIVIDANSIIHRAYHALPPLTTRAVATREDERSSSTTKKGELVNAVYGFLLVFFKAIKEFQPDYVAACFDVPGPTFRHKKYKGYKAKRPPTPKELYQQIPKVKEILDAFSVPIFEKEGFEADDIIGTIAKQAAEIQNEKSLETVIVSGDLDTLQLIDPHTKVYALRKGVKDTVLYDEKLVKEKFRGLTPQQLLDFKALKGDPSDNIPGVKGVGEKTAIRLIGQFSNLENLYQNFEKKTAEAEKVKPKLRESLLSQKEQAFFSKSLIQLNQNVPIDFNFKKCFWGQYNEEKAIKALKSFEFYSLIERLSEFKEKSKEGLSIGENLRLW